MFGGLAIVLVLVGVSAGLFLWPAAPATSPETSPAAQPAAASEPTAAAPSDPSSSPGPAGGDATAAGSTTPPTAASSSTAPEPTPPSDTGTPAGQKTGRAESSSPVTAASTRSRRDAAAAGRRATEPRTRTLNLPQMLEQARSAMARGDHLAAIAGFESILKADPKYPQAAELLRVARGNAQNAAQLALDAGAKSEAGGDYASAGRQYERAQQLDPESASAPEALKRLRAKMRAEGEDAFKRAKQFDALGRSPDAIAMYEKALRLLQGDHPSAATAKERLAALRGGS